MPAATDLPSRLAFAIDRLSPAQRAALQAERAQRGLPPCGIKATVAALAGLPTPSVLSDILAGRARGLCHLDDLARVLGVEPRWLRGDDEGAPDIALEPLEAWERFEQRIAVAWRGRFGQQPGEDDTCLDALTHDPQRLARLLDLPGEDPDVEAIAAFDLARCSFDSVLRLAAVLELPPPMHEEHLRYGHASARQVALRVERALAQARRRHQRYTLPPALFDLVRHALAVQRSRSRRETRAIDDCLEVLWRQRQWGAGRPRREVADGFRQDTGRQAWTPLAEIHQRHAVQ